MDPWLFFHTSIAFFALAMTIISVWVKPSPWIWGPFLLIAFALAYVGKIITPVALAPIGGLLILHTFLKGEIKGLARFVLVLITIALSLGLALHKLPGFHNLLILDHVQISKGAYPFTLYLNFDKPFIGLFILALGFPLIRNTFELKTVLRTAIPLSLGGIAIMIALALFSGQVALDPKFPQIFWFFLVENLIFTCIIEEAFWRGFVQREMFYWLGGRGFLANVGAVLCTAFFFALLHYFWVPSLPFLALVFVAAIIYGSIYQFTRALEASILCHWLFNMVHFLLFTYPALKP